MRAGQVTLRANGDISIRGKNLDIRGDKIDIKGSGDVSINGRKIAQN